MFMCYVMTPLMPLLLSPSLTELCIHKFLPTLTELTSGKEYRWRSAIVEKLEVAERRFCALRLTLSADCESCLNFMLQCLCCKYCSH